MIGKTSAVESGHHTCAPLRTVNRPRITSTLDLTKDVVRPARKQCEKRQSRRRRGTVRSLHELQGRPGDDVCDHTPRHCLIQQQIAAIAEVRSEDISRDEVTNASPNLKKRLQSP